MFWQAFRRMSAQYRTTILFVGLAAAWGSGFVAIKAGLPYYPPMLYASLRNGLAAILMCGYAFLVSNRLRPYGWREWLAVIASGVLVIGASQGLLFFGQQATTSGVAAVITGTIPILTAGFARVAPPVEYLGCRDLLGLLVGLVGIGIIAQPSPEQLSGAIGGKWLVLLGASCFAFGSTIVQRASVSLPAETQQAWAMSIGALLISLTSVTLGESLVSVRWTNEAIGALFYLVVVPSGLGFLLYFRILERLGPTDTNLVTNASPVFASLIGWLVLGEELNLLTIGGFVVVLIGLGLLLTSKSAISSSEV